MFVLCISPDGVVLRLVSVLYSLMVEKAESLLRDQWSAFNIYRAVSLLRLVLASRLLRLAYCVSSWASRSSSRRRLLVVASFRSILSSCFVFCPCVLLVADAWSMSSVGRLMSVASRRGRLVAFLRLVSRFVHRLVSFFALFIVPSCSCLYPWRETRRAGRGVDVLVIMWSGR